MVKEILELPAKPNSLKNMDPTKFRPMWTSQGRRFRLTLARKTFDYVDKLLYEKCFKYSDVGCLSRGLGVDRSAVKSEFDLDVSVWRICLKHSTFYTF